MTSTRKSALTAMVMFSLIFAVVLGGMSWATLASFELAKKTVSEEHLARVSRALARIDSQIKGILYFEASRPYTDYVDFHLVRPEAVYTRDSRELDAVALLPSPLTDEKPLYDWIDLYFQVDHKARPSTPQFDEERIAVRLDALEPHERRARDAWAWFQRALPSLNLHVHVSEALVRDEQAAGATEMETTTVVRVAQPAAPESATGSTAASRQFVRRGGVTDSQRRYLPPVACVAPLIAKVNMGDLSVAIDSGFDESDVSPVPVQFSAGPFAPPFWVQVGPSQGSKLAFVRECHADADVMYQGFIGDWERLKPELLRPIEDLFADADLEPIPNDAELDSDDSTVKLHSLPAVLRVPDIPGGTSAAAWRSLWGVLVISWTAAVAVLVTAGWGVRNLVALTERRLQFAYAVTHELRTPLTTFRLYADMLSAGLVPPASRQEYLDTLNRESQRLSTLVEAVLEYARLENHKVRLHVSETNAGALLQTVGETLRQRCLKHAVEPQTQSHLPDEHGVRTDVSLVNQIAAVLVDNACRHARSAKSPQVLVQLGADNGRLHLDVVDSGPGVDLADAHHIFKPFRRGRDADTAARGGIGLGLALARNWASLLGGRLDLVARHDPQLGGARFRLTIPSHS